VTQRHIARSMAVQQRRSVVGMAAVILAMIAASRAGNSDLTQAAVMGGQAAMVQGQLNYSRDMEREADRIGFGTFVAAGFAPAGMAQMFERLQGAVRLMDDNAFPYLRSHPLTVERIAEARGRVEGLPAAPPTSALLEHPLMQARARVLMDRTDAGLARQQAQRPAETATPAERLGLWYGSALAALQRRDLPAAAAALAQVEAILQASPLREPATARLKLPLLLLQAQVRAAAGDPAGAVAIIDASGLATTHRAALLARASAALQAARAGGEPGPAARARLRESTEALQVWVAERRNDALAWSQLSQCAGQLGLAMRAVRAEAEARAAVGDLVGAIDRLRAAQALARDPSRADFVELSVIDARLRELRAQRQGQIAAQRGSRLGEAPRW
jgi:predicted Zn-dependent protease